MHEVFDEGERQLMHQRVLTCKVKLRGARDRLVGDLSQGCEPMQGLITE